VKRKKRNKYRTDLRKGLPSKEKTAAKLKGNEKNESTAGGDQAPRNGGGRGIRHERQIRGFYWEGMSQSRSGFEGESE